MTFEEWLDKNEDEYASVYRQYAEEVENPEPLIDFLEHEWKKTIDTDGESVIMYYEGDNNLIEEIVNEPVEKELPVNENFQMVYVDADTVDTASQLALYREYAEEKMNNGYEHFKTFSEFREEMNA